MKERYQKLHCALWNDPQWRSCADDAQLAYLFALSHPHMTGIGALRATLPGLAAEKNWSVERLSKGFSELSAKGFLKVDEGSMCIVIPGFIGHNPPENPNVVVGWGKALAMVPDCTLKQAVLLELEREIRSRSKPFQKAFERVTGTLLKTVSESESESVTVDRNRNRKPNPSPAGPSGFELFWRSYPRKQGKGAVEKWFRKHKPDDVLLGIMLGKIDCFKKTDQWQRDDGKFIPMPSTWLNQKRWEDEAQPNGDKSNAYSGFEQRDYRTGIW